MWTYVIAGCFFVSYHKQWSVEVDVTFRQNADLECT
jgi:hypothetical protein